MSSVSYRFQSSASSHLITIWIMDTKFWAVWSLRHRDLSMCCSGSSLDGALGSARVHYQERKMIGSLDKVVVRSLSLCTKCFPVLHRKRRGPQTHSNTLRYTTHTVSRSIRTKTMTTMHIMVELVIRRRTKGCKQGKEESDFLDALSFLNT